MRFLHEIRYDAPLADVSDMLDDPAFRLEVIAAQGGLNGSVEIETVDEVTTALIDQELEARGIPSFAKKFIGSTVHTAQREEWTSAEYADLHIAVPGKPGEMVGSITLAEDGGATTETVEGEITVTVPLIGGKLEKLIADLLHKALRAEERLGHEYLSR